MQGISSRALKALWAAVPVALPVLASLLAGQAQAVPSYARQTGQDCAACHIGAFGPHLTPFGIKFKLGGYVDSDGKADKIPLSAMVVADYSRYKETNDAGDLKSTSKTTLSEASIFLAGKLTDHMGSFVQVTHDGVAHSTSIDQVDLRYTGTLNVAGKDALIGVSVNNNPTVQDPFNTLPVWGFPYTSSPYANTVGAEFSGVGGTEQKVIGVNAYALLDDSIYAELGLYNTLSPSVQSRLGLSKAEGQSFGRINNAPYWRLGYLKDMRTSAWTVGLFGFDGSIKDRQSGDLTNKFKDFGVDASYQFLGTREHVVTVNGSYIREHTRTPAEDAPDVRNTVKDLRLSTSYHFQNTYGASMSYFKSTSADQLSGNRGYIYQLDWTPWGKESSWYAPLANLRVGLQYIAYKRFVEFDEASETATVLSKPGDKNTLGVFAWTAF